MIKRTFGAPWGGTPRGGQYGVDCAALRSIFPPNGGGGAGSWSPGIVVVAAGEPGTPVICCAGATAPRASKETTQVNVREMNRLTTLEHAAVIRLPPLSVRTEQSEAILL